MIEAQASSSRPLRETVSVDYVLVPFVPLGERGQPLSNLRERDVELFVDGTRVQTDLFDRAIDSPVSFTLLLDGSGSMALAGKMDGARAAVRILLENGRPGDDYSLHLFAEGEVRELVPFTREGSRILAAMQQVEPWGETALYDALLRIPDRTLLGSNGSRAIILLTDGLDNASEHERDQIPRLFQGVDVPVYPLALRSLQSVLAAAREGGNESMIDTTVLAALAQMSGGRMALAPNPKDLEREVQIILDELRSQYLIGFAPTGRGEVRYRQISLRFTRPVRSVRVRGGYRGTEPPVLALTSQH